MAGARPLRVPANGPQQAREEIGRRGLKLSGGTVGGALHRDEAWDADLAAARRVAALVQAMGAHYVIYLPEGYRDQQGKLLQPPTLEGDDWKRLVSRVSEIGRTFEGDYGVRLVFHPHADTHVETQEQVERFLEDTEASVVSLCLDTGHISYCGGDNLALIERFPDRIGYVHLKQVRRTYWLKCGQKDKVSPPPSRGVRFVSRPTGSLISSP